MRGRQASGPPPDPSARLTTLRHPPASLPSTHPTCCCWQLDPDGALSVHPPEEPPEVVAAEVAALAEVEEPLLPLALPLQWPHVERQNPPEVSQDWLQAPQAWKRARAGGRLMRKGRKRPQAGGWPHRHQSTPPNASLLSPFAAGRSCPKALGQCRPRWRSRWWLMSWRWHGLRWR